jgi:inner membrane protein
VNKFYINSIFKKALIADGIPYIRYTTQPTILNNILWYSIAESKEAYYVSFYSLLDSSSSNLSWKRIPKNHSLMDIEHPDIQKLKWFSNGYYNFESVKGGEELRYNDLRYIMLVPDGTYDFVFSFLIFKDGERYNTLPFYGKKPSKRDFEFFIKRINGE